jgi:hypothetical protein
MRRLGGDGVIERRAAAVTAEACYVKQTMRTPGWLAVALAVHAAALAAIVLAPVRPMSGRSSASSDVPSVASLETASVDVSFEGAAGATAEAAREPSSGQPPQPSREASSALTPSRAATTGAASATPGASSSEPMAMSNSPQTREPAPSGPGEPSPGGVVALPLTPGELGISGAGGRNPFLPRAEEKEPTSGPNTPAARAMRGTGLAHDRELGLGPEGPAIAALSEATTASIAPLQGRATFIVRTGGDGLVSAVDLLDSEGGPGWLDAGRIAFEKLRGKKMNVPRGASGMHMHIEVLSQMKLPNGQNSPVGSRLGDNGMPEMIIPDVSNIGSKPRRVIHARVVGTDVF